MAFKMNGWSAGHGTGSNSALTKKTDERVEYAKKNTDSSTFPKTSTFSKKRTWAEAKEANPNLSSLVAERNKLRDSGDTSSEAYNKLQNEINEAYNVSKRHDASADTPATSTEQKFQEHKGPDIALGNVTTDEKAEEKKNTSDPFAGGGSGEDKFDKKKFKDTRLGKFLGVGQGDKRKANRARRKAERKARKNMPGANKDNISDFVQNPDMVEAEANKKKKASDPFTKPKVKYDKHGNIRKEKFTDVDGNKVKIKYKKDGTKVKVGGSKVVLDPNVDPDKQQLYTKHLDHPNKKTYKY